MKDLLDRAASWARDALLAMRRIYRAHPVLLTFAGVFLIFAFNPPDFITTMRKFSEDDAVLAGLDTLCTLVSRVVAVAVVLAVALLRRDLLKNEKFLMLFLGVCVISIGINMGPVPMVQRLGANVVYLGLALSLRLMHEVDEDWPRNVLMAFYTAFGLFSLASAFIDAFVYQMPTGAVYFFGGKNSIFMQVGVPLIACLGFEELRARCLPTLTPIVAALSAVAAWRVDSASSLVFLALMALALVLMRTPLHPERYVKMWMLLLFGLVVYVDTVVLRTNFLVGWALPLLGRNATFSGRQTLWDQGFEKIAQSPLTGMGTGLSYRLLGGTITNHPHSYYLQLGASYGLIALAFFLLDAIQTAIGIDRDKRRDRAYLLTLVMGAVLLHSMYDNLDLTVYLILRFLARTPTYGRQLPARTPAKARVR